MPSPRLLLHAGAGRALAPDHRAEVQAHLAALGARLSEELRQGAAALEVVTRAVRSMEDHPRMNAGTGSRLQVDGVARLSAALMDGDAERFSGVVNVEGLKNPILLAFALQEDEARVLAGKGARARARELGLEEGEVRTAERLAEWRAAVDGQTGTVGAVALDAQGRLAAATSTGGRGMEPVGRVSDSPTVAGTYANRHAAVSLTGVGEQIVDGALAARLVALVEAGLPLHEAGARLHAQMRRRGWQVGLIALDAQGGALVLHTTPAMSVWADGPARMVVPAPGGGP